MSEAPEQQTGEESTKALTFDKAIDDYSDFLNSIISIAPLTTDLAIAKLLQESQHLESFLSTKDIPLEVENEEDQSKNTEDDNGRNFRIREDDFSEFSKLMKDITTTRRAMSFLPVSFVVSFVSQFDAYLGNLIRTLFFIRPEIINSSTKNILFSELVNFKSISEAREFIIDKEVESVIRESHIVHFEWLEGKLDMPLRKDLPSFPKFIEITERRNLFVHTNGIVSRQYISVCKKHGVKIKDDLKLGQKLGATPKYLLECYEVLMEIGIKLGHVMWRKVQPDKLEDADDNLNTICYELIKAGRYKLAINLLSFATDILKKHYSQESKYFFIINKALAYYLDSQKEETKRILDKTDWSATGDIFKVAHDVLSEEFDKASEIMISVGPTNKYLTKTSYREWPLFSNFRKTELFKSTYKVVFNEDFIHVEKEPKGLTDIVQDLKEMKSKKVKESTDIESSIQEV